MTAYTWVRVRCDWPDCSGVIETHRSKITEARKYASKRGWRTVSGLDLCGPRDQAEEFTDSFTLSTLQGHATRKDHAPVIKPGRKGYIKLSCLCGWTVPPQYSWDVAGECTRNSADLRWGAHVKEAEHGALLVTRPNPTGGDAE
jgi:hypothetical protein